MAGPARAKLALESVLPRSFCGRVVRLELTREQKRALRDRDGQIALDVLRHLLGAREAMGAVGRFPLSEHAFQAIARKLGYDVGQKRARALACRLVEAGITEEAGHYRQEHHNSAGRDGFHVRLLRLAVAVARTVAAFGKTYLPVGSRPSVKRQSARRWWAHPLFGDYWDAHRPGFIRAEPGVCAHWTRFAEVVNPACSNRRHSASSSTPWRGSGWTADSGRRKRSFTAGRKTMIPS